MMEVTKTRAINRSRSERKRTPTMLAAICKLVKKGLSIPHAAEKVHVHHTTIGRWRQDDPKFNAALLAAESAFIEEQIENIRSAGKRNWCASAWLLERKWPQFFSQPQVQLNMPGAKLPFEDLAMMLEAIRNSPCARNALEQAGVDMKLLPVPEEKLVAGKEITPFSPSDHQP
jgi:hypothetical protein